MHLENKEKGRRVDVSLLILGVLVLTALVASLWIGGWQLTYSGFIKAGQLFQSVWFRLCLGFLFGGLIQVLIPRSLISKWLGPTSGLKGIFIGSYISIFVSGSPYMWFPVVASVYRAGAGVGPIMSLVTARAILSIQMLLVWQIPFFGVELPLSRYIVCLFIPPIVGLAGNAVFRMMGWPTHMTNGDKESTLDNERETSNKVIKAKNHQGK